MIKGWLEGWAPVWRVAARHRRPVAALAAVSLVGALMEAGFLVLVTGTVLALANGEERLTPILGVGIRIPVALAIGLAALALRLAIAIAGVRITATLTARATAEERARLAHAFLRASWPVQQREPSGRLQELLSTFVWKVTQTAQLLAQGVTAALSVVAFLGTGLAIDPLLTLGVLVALGVLGAILAPLRARARRISGRASASGLQFATSVAELGTLGQEMHVFGAQRSFIDRLDDLSRETIEENRRLQVTQGLLTPVYTSLAYLAVLAGMAVLWTTGARELAAVGAIMLLMLRSLSYAQQLLTVSGQLTANVPVLERLSAVTQEYADEAAPTGDAVPERLTLDLRGVRFGYDADRVVLHDVTARIRPGELIGVIGPSGAGKSTLAQLLLGLRDPTAGEILVSGIDLRDLDREWWTRRVAFVPQEPRLITGTVAENVRFFREWIAAPALTEAARQANVLAEIEALPEGFDTHLGERGSRLSGGQRQRMSIARALAGGPELLIMDEPTSALDGRSEALIRRTMADLHGRVTMIVIAHRLSTLELCDRIMVIEHGQVTAFDTPAALLATSRYYRRALEETGVTPGEAVGEPPS
jgi:ABC-type multidrug transport system fused ATPase/permease subunit